jgi:hypothetical protein
MSRIGSSTEDASMAAFVSSACQALLKASSRSHKALRTECQRVIDALANEQKAQEQAAVAAADGHVVSIDTSADKYFLPLKLACDTQQTRLLLIALDAIHKLIAYGYLDGNSPVDLQQYPIKAALHSQTQALISPAPTGTPGTPGTANATGSDANSGPDAERRLSHVIMETLFEASAHKDQQVQLQVLKGALTAVSSVSCNAHELALLFGLRACYLVYPQAADDVTKTTAKATLTQIVNLVFNRLEHAATQLKQLHHTEKMLLARKRKNAKTVQLLPPPAVPPTSGITLNGAHETKEETVPEPSSAKHEDGTSATLTANAPASAQSSPETPSPAPTASPSMPPVRLTRGPQGKRGWCVVCGLAANHYCLQVRSAHLAALFVPHFLPSLVCALSRCFAHCSDARCRVRSELQVGQS